MIEKETDRARERERRKKVRQILTERERGTGRQTDRQRES